MNPFKGRHFQRDIILWAVRWYCKYGISYRELQEMLAERGVNVDHSTIYRWVQRYAPEMEKRLRWYWRNPSDLCPWHMDETYVKVNGRWAYLYRVVDSRGRTVDFYLSSRRNRGPLGKRKLSYAKRIFCTDGYRLNVTCES
ncbi:putative transposase protein TnpA-rve [Escherichia coli]|nr:putative transposase protein TnpA-rve [Escherichia coli]